MSLPSYGSPSKMKMNRVLPYITSQRFPLPLIQEHWKVSGPEAAVFSNYLHAFVPIKPLFDETTRKIRTRQLLDFLNESVGGTWRISDHVKEFWTLMSKALESDILDGSLTWFALPILDRRLKLTSIRMNKGYACATVSYRKRLEFIFSTCHFADFKLAHIECDEVFIRRITPVAPEAVRVDRGWIPPQARVHYQEDAAQSAHTTPSGAYEQKRERH